MSDMKNSPEEAERLYSENVQLVDYWIRRDYGTVMSSIVADELYSEGCRALMKAAENFDPENETGAKFTTYASEWIKRSLRGVSKATRRKTGTKGDTVRPPKPDEYLHEKTADQETGKNDATRRALQVLEVMRMWSDEKHSLTQQDIIDWHSAYCYIKHGLVDSPDRRTMSSTITSIITELNASGNIDGNSNAQRIRYTESNGKISELAYVHLFEKGEMDSLIEAVCFSDMLTAEEKNALVAKIFSTASEYYESPFWDRDDQKILFNPVTVHGRLSKRYGGGDIAANNSMVQRAIAGKNLISFKFNHYTEDGALEPNRKADTDEPRIYTLRPYHLVVYHDNYYCLGFHQGSENVFHYRVDLMSDIEIVCDEDGKPLKEKTVPVDDYTFVNDFWNPESYMAEHIYMAYGKPRDIRIRVDNRDGKGFTSLHDWFGDHYRVVHRLEGDDPGYITVEVKADPAMIVHWAMQYSGLVEVLDSEVRAMIRDELEMMRKKYE